jgi:Trypsin-like peptidase domain
MMITMGNRLVAGLAIALAVAAPAAVRAAGTTAGGTTAAGAVTAGQRAAVYWTPARMTAAARAAGGSANAWLTGNTAGRGLRWAHGGAVTRSLGKVFFTLGGTDYACSGAAVDSAHADVVLTAAHCVSDGAGHSAAHWVFVPGYRDGTAPYGVYAARRFFVSPGWPASEPDDIAFVQVNKALPGGLPVAFTGRPPPGDTYVFGYPAESPYSGQYPDYCAGREAAARGGSALPCAMTAGDSGGPWLTGFRPRPGTGTIVAVSTYKLTGDMRVLYGAVLGSGARDIYQQAAVSPVR